MSNESIRRIASESNRENFFLSVGDFLESFRYADESEKRRMLADPPLESDEIGGNQFCFLAAMAHKLSNDNGLVPPVWVWEEKYYSTEHPYFSPDVKGKLRRYFMYKSPPEFKHRNVFVDPNVLGRV